MKFNYLPPYISLHTVPKQEEDIKVREKVLHNLRVKGAFGAQELYDKHRGMYALCEISINQAYKLVLMLATLMQ